MGKGFARGFLRAYKRRGVMCMTTTEVFFGLIAVASLALTIYFGTRSR